MTTLHNYIRRPRAATQSLTARAVANAYGIPMSSATGKGVTLAVVELGGGFSVSAIDAALAKKGIKRGGSLEFVSIDGAKNTEDGPNGADGEVQSDILVILEVAPDVNLLVVTAPNTDAGFYDGLDYAFGHAHAVSLSWGGSELEWDSATMTKFAARIAAAAGAGVPLFAASGDSGGQDGERRASVDFPASAPATIAIGGTRLTLNTGGARLNEVTWDDDDTTSATGGGVSVQFPGRDVPDFAGNADPDTGYQVTVDGEDVVIGGTSLITPLYAAGYAILLQLNATVPFNFRALVIANPSVCFDVTSGDNGVFRAGPGRDETTGFGVVDFGKLLAVLRTGAPPVTTAPTPPAAPPAGGTAFPTPAVAPWVDHAHNYTAAEAAAKKAIVAWAATQGITL